MPSVTKQQLPDPAPHRHLDEAAQERLRELETAHLPAHSLRRTGQRPYAFNGAVVATICGVTPLLPYWYELNVDRTVIGTCVSDGQVNTMFDSQFDYKMTSTNVRIHMKSADSTQVIWIFIKRV